MKNINHSILLLILLVLPQMVFAQQISEGEAMSKAMSFFAEHSTAQSGIKKAPSQGSSNQITLAYTAGDSNTNFFYVYNRGENGGFVIVGGDEVAQEILAYSDHGHFDYTQAPANFKNLLEQYAGQIRIAKYSANNQPTPQRVKRTTATPVQKVDIPDLIQTTWDQGDPYNRAIPKLVNSNTSVEYTPPTGCVQTAVAQIMKYWNYPEHGTGHRTRVLDYSQINGYNPGTSPFTPEFGVVVHDIDFASATYDWVNMLNNYTGEETEAQINAVSKLMYHIGVASNAVWGVYETTGAEELDALITYFNYSPKAIEIRRNNFDNETWEEIIYSELHIGRPVLYYGTGSNYAGHEYIIHGYSSQYDMYKVNWGWGGSMDCYCKLASVDGSSILLGYENNQGAVIRLQPSTMDSESSLEYGDTFWKDGVKYAIVSSVFNTVEVTRPEREETQYVDTINIPATVNYQGTDYSVIGLGESCFATLSRIEEDGTEWWSPDDSQIKEVNIANGPRYINSDAFENCGNIQHIDIPNSVTEIGTSAFDHCVKLKSISLPNNLTAISDRLFDWCRELISVNVPEGCSSVGSRAFNWCEKLNMLTLPSSLESIDESALNMCDNLDILICKAVTPPTIKSSFPTSAGAGYLLVPEESIGLYREAQYWKDWKNILPIDSIDLSTLGETITIDGIQYKLMPNGAEVVNVSIYNVPKITIPDTIAVNNKGYKVTTLGTELNFNCDTIVLPQYLTAIKSSAFQYSSAKEILMPSGVTSIGSSVFYFCRNLEKVVLPDSLKEIPESCIQNCDNLFLVVLPQNIKTISYSAFPNCPNLFTIVCRAEDVPVWNDMELNYHNYIEGTIYVPSASIDNYRASKSWKEFRFIKSIDSFDENENITIERNGLSYRLLKHGAVVGLQNSITEEEIIIPDSVKYEGLSYNVISIAQNALNWQSSITTVHLPSCLHSILDYSFSRCQGLQSINLPDSLEYLGYGAFENCTSLQSINIPSSLKILSGSFNNTAIEQLIIPEGVEKVGGFYGMASLKEVVLPSSLRMKGYGAEFNNHTERVYVLSPDSIGHMGGRQTTAYVPNEFLEKYQHENDENNFFGKWYFKEVLPIIPLTSVAFNQEEVSINEGNIDSLAITCTPNDASLKYFKWTSSDPAIASVNKDGIVQAYSEGTVTIYARSMYYPELVDSCIVHVNHVATGIENIGIDSELNGNNHPEKARIVFDGQNFFILRGRKTYTITGQEVR